MLTVYGVQAGGQPLWKSKLHHYQDFISFCEELWRGWLASTLDLPSFVHTAFDLGAAPEPYVRFGAGRNPLVALLTNPGYTMCHQCRAAVEAGDGPLSSTVEYSAAARALGRFYERELKGAAAARIAALGKLSSMAGLQGVLQVEVCPFHSRSLPRKRTLLRTIDEGGLLGRYAERLEKFLRRRPVVIVSAVSSNRPLGIPAVKRNDWLRRLAKIAGLELDRAKCVRLVLKNTGRNTKVTAAAVVSFTGVVPKALVLMMGNNILPAEKGLRVLAEALRPTSAQL